MEENESKDLGWEALFLEGAETAILSEHEAEITTLGYTATATAYHERDVWRLNFYLAPLGGVAIPGEEVLEALALDRFRYTDPRFGERGITRTFEVNVTVGSAPEK